VLTGARYRVALTAALVVVLVITSCTRLIGGQVKMGYPPLGAPIQWQACETEFPSFNDAPRNAECGELAVPIDYNNPGAGVATLAVIRFPATGDKIGSLVMNPGGPGGSGMTAATWMYRDVPEKLRQNFDFVGFDPRGVGLSRPSVRCNSDADTDKERTEPQVDYSPAGVASIEKDSEQYIQRCVDKTGKEFLASVGTASAVKDMDALRAGLGDDKLTYIGFSYGTELGGEYAAEFPQKVRAMVLDGAVDPTVEPMNSNLDQAKAFEQAFNDFAADCAKSTNCPLGTDPAKAIDVLHSFVNPLVGKPAKTKDPRGLSYPDAQTAIASALYSPGLWDKLTSGLSALKSGASADDLLELADNYMGRDAKGHYDNSSDAFNAISCVDAPYPKDQPAWIAYDKERRAVSPWDSYGQFTGDAPKGTCAFWPVPPTSRPHGLSAPGLPPVLVISTTHDPATPYIDGVHLAEQLHAALLTVEGTQHTAAFYGDDCVDNIVTDYLLDLKLPASNARC
jgi:pimeloyl-ACP methyl ester carboxylesterase